MLTSPSGSIRVPSCLMSGLTEAKIMPGTFICPSWHWSETLQCSPFFTMSRKCERRFGIWLGDIVAGMAGKSSYLRICWKKWKKRNVQGYFKRDKKSRWFWFACFHVSFQIVLPRIIGITEVALELMILVGIFVSHQRIFVFVPQRALTALVRSTKIWNDENDEILREIWILESAARLPCSAMWESKLFWVLKVRLQASHRCSRSNLALCV